MIQVTVGQRRTTAAIMLGSSTIGIAGSVYLFRFAYLLALRPSSSGLDVALFACGGAILGLVVLLSWLAAYCLVFRYAQAVRRVNGSVLVATENGDVEFPRQKVRRLWTTGKIFIARAKGGVEFALIQIERRFLVCPKENIQI